MNDGFCEGDSKNADVQEAADAQSEDEHRRVGQKRGIRSHKPYVGLSAARCGRLRAFPVNRVSMTQFCKKIKDHVVKEEICVII